MESSSHLRRIDAFPPRFSHYIGQQVNCRASSNIHHEPVTTSLLRRLHFAANIFQFTETMDEFFTSTEIVFYTETLLLMN